MVLVKQSLEKCVFANQNALVSSFGFGCAGPADTRTQWRQGGDLRTSGSLVCVQLPSNHKLLRL